MIEFLIAAMLILTAIMLTILLRFQGKLGKTLDENAVKGALATCWKELGIDKDIGAIRERATDIQNATQSLQTLFKVTRGRGEYGEFQLEHVLKDLLPPQYIHIRERISQSGKIPDAHIVTPQGTLCIDSKFPLDNYRRLIEASDEDQRKSCSTDFCSDVRTHIEKIKNDYVRPEEGTTSFAFCFIPSEAVYQYLTECEPSVVAQAAKDGVLLVSPATLAINLNLLSIGLRATEISEKAQQIERNLGKLSKSLEELESSWNTLHSHIRNASTKAGEVYEKIGKLRSKFDQVTQKED